MSLLRLMIEPRDPLIFRDGKPFSAGLWATSLPFPPPPTTVGMMRTICGAPTSYRDVEALRQINQRGPFLAYSSDDGENWDLALPAPADAVAYDLTDSPLPNDALKLVRLLSETPTACTDFTELPYFVKGMTESKPSRRLPEFWHWSFYRQWLLSQAGTAPQPSAIGPPALPRQRRVHVALTPKTQTASEGLLFATESVEFEAREHRIRDTTSRFRFALISEFRLRNFTANPLPSLALLGGEGRMVHLSEGGPALPDCPPEIRQARRVRLILATPAAFQAGWRPEWLTKDGGSPPGCDGLRLRLVAACVPRPQPISGWKLERPKPGPKASRLLAPAGSVYFCEAEGDPSVLWLNSISESGQDARDGFGIVTLGVWDL
jgi:CRISPR-associated protein Cmr3